MSSPMLTRLASHQLKDWKLHKPLCRITHSFNDRDETRALSHRPLVAAQREFDRFIVDTVSARILPLAPFLIRFAYEDIPIPCAEQCPSIVGLMFDHISFLEAGPAGAGASEPRRRYRLTGVWKGLRSDYINSKESGDPRRENFTDEAMASRTPRVHGDSQVEVAIQLRDTTHPDLTIEWLFISQSRIGPAEAWELEPDASEKLFAMLSEALDEPH
ncbi:hypothetical protein RQP46_003431 [Phenoliferia psychrophenolica]